MNSRSTHGWTLFAVHISMHIIAMLVEQGQAMDNACRRAFVPCPKTRGFQFFNKTCYAVIRDSLPFGAGDAFLKCQSGMHLAFNEPAMRTHYQQMEQRSGLDLRMTLARVASRGSLRTLTELQRQTVTGDRELTLVGLACSVGCDEPSGWIFPGTDLHTAAGALECAAARFCNWRLSGPSAWARPPGSPPPPAALVGDLWTPAALAGGRPAPLSNRLAVLAGPAPGSRLAALTDAPQTLQFNSVACEIPFHTSKAGIHALMDMGIATAADLSMHAQAVPALAVRAADANQTRVLLSWQSPRCPVAAFYVTVQRDAAVGSARRTQVSTDDACRPGAGCQLQLELPSCSFVYIKVGGILNGEDAVPSVVEWQTPPLSDPPKPSKFFVSEVIGQTVTLSWRGPVGGGPCQPYHEVTVEGLGQVKLDPGVSRIVVHLGAHCAHFNASIRATLMGRHSDVYGPIHGVTGPTAPDSVEVTVVAARWSSLRWSHADNVSSPCVATRYRVSCRPLPPRRPATELASAELRLTITGLTPGTRYRCGVCALVNLTQGHFAQDETGVAPCGEERFVEFVTNETEPGAPSGLKVTTVGHDSMTLAWQRPAQPNGVIVSYNVSVVCERQTFPLCSADPLCTNRSFLVELAGNDTDHVTHRLTGLQAARRHHVTVAAATRVGQGAPSPPAVATTLPGEPPAPRDVTVTPLVKTPVGKAEQTSITVSLRPPCPYPGLHGYRLQFERVDFLASYRSTVRSGSLSRADIDQLYSGQRNISFSVFDGKWTPSFQYRLRIVAMSENTELGERAQTASAPVTFTMTVPPPGPVSALKADCSTPLRLAFSWANPSQHAFGIVRYRTRFRCRHAATGREAAGRHSCHHAQCPCASSRRGTDECAACERVCSYPVRQYEFMGQHTYYFNCTCRREPRRALVMPGSLCQVAVQAISQYHESAGAVAGAECRAPPHTARVTGLQLACGRGRLVAEWSAPRPLQVPTDAYHVTVLRGAGSGRTRTFVSQTLEPSVCRSGRCRAEWPGVIGDVTYLVKVAAESVYASPPVGPPVEQSCRSPPRVPGPPPGDLQRLLVAGSSQRGVADRARQFRLQLPAGLYDRASGVLRELRIVVSAAGGESEAADAALPAGSGPISDLPTLPSWRDFVSNRSGHYQASAASLASTDDGYGLSSFLLGGDLSCSTENQTAGLCNGALRPNTSYTAQLMFVNGAGFSVSRPVTFRTWSTAEARSWAANEAQTPETGGEQATRSGPGPGSQPAGRVAGDQSAEAQQTAGRAGSGAAAGGGGSGAGGAGSGAGAGGSQSGAGGSGAGATATPPAGPSSSSAPPEEAVAVSWVSVAAAIGSLTALVTICGGVFCVRRRCGGHED